MNEIVGLGIHPQYCGCCNLAQFQGPHQALVEGELIAPDLELPWKMAFVDPLQAFDREGVRRGETVLGIWLSDRLAVYSLPKLWTGCSTTSGILSPSTIKEIRSFLAPFRIERLRDFGGFILILAHPRSSANLFRSRAVQAAV